MSRRYDPRRRCLKLAEWPEADRRVWEAACASGSGRFSQRSRATTFNGRSLRKIAGGYGRWLGFLAWHGWLVPEEAPAARATPERLDAYFEELLELGNADYTVIGRFDELQKALRILAPRTPRPDILRPHGISLRSFLEMRRKERTVRSPAELYGWGMELMEAALTRSPRRRQVGLRDGLLICVLAARAPRRRSTWSLVLGQSIGRERETGLWWVDLPSEDVKNKKPIRYALPESLAPWIDRYLAVERAELLAGQASDAFWVNWGGKALGEAGLEKRIRWLSAKRYGAEETFGPHYFRYCLSESSALLAPDQPGLAASVLQITCDVLDRHYDRSDRVKAAQSYGETVRQCRRTE